MGIIEIWSLVAVILHCCEVNYFGTLPIIDWPWHWSCLCLELWVVFIYIALIASYLFFSYKLKKIERNNKLEKIRKLEANGYQKEADMLKKCLDK